MKRRVAITAFLVAALAAGSIVFRSSPAQATSFNFSKLNKIQQRIISGYLYSGLASHSQAPTDNNGGGADGMPNAKPGAFAVATTASTTGGNYYPSGPTGCPTTRSNNGVTDVKVNQNCLNISDPDLQGRAQANNEQFIAADPFAPNHVVASANDYVRGDGTCGAYYSLDNGATWNNSTVPNIFTRGNSPFARQYWGGGGDTSVAWDTRGNSYLSCQVFNRGNNVSQDPDQSSAFLLFRSTGNNGASWNFPGRYVFVNFDNTGANGGAPFEDKQLLTVDNNLGSPFRDRIYVTWTEFAADGTAIIYEAYSSDYGETFSPRVVVSASSAFCTNNFGVPTTTTTCNENQFSQPFVSRDGALYVAYANFNNQPTAGTDNRYEILLAKSTDGGNTFSAPVKVSDYYDLPDCATYQGGQDPGRSCVPEKGSSMKSVFRASNYPSGAVSPANTSEIVVTFGSYISEDSNPSNGCVPAGFAADGNPTYTGVKTPGACNNKILAAVSHDGGATFGSSAEPTSKPVVSQADSQETKDQWFQWAAFNKDNKLAVNYYDRQYGDDESTGWSDFTLSSNNSADNVAVVTSGLLHFSNQRVTTSSMPPPTQFTNSSGNGVFYGDYTGLAAVNDAHPIWSDTRSVDLFICPGTATTGNPPQLCTATEPNSGTKANDQDVYTARFPLPD